jgi:hypothetical protein
LSAGAFAQDSIFKKVEKKEYSFTIQDSPASLFTMRQFNENYLSLYRLTINELNGIVSPKASLLLQTAVLGLYFLPLTHEEGHRSILTNEKIGSISKPYFDKNLAAYVVGVSDAELITLRNSKLPTYIRLHTSGLESDYAILLREGSLLNWGEEAINVIVLEYFLRKFSYISYYAMGLFKYDTDIKEDTNELNRDIVGHDVYGAIRHLYRPDMEFYRYTKYNDLSSEEKQFVKRLGWRSLLNFLDPLLLGKTGFPICNKFSFNFGIGSGMSPFGDFIDEHFWLKTESMKTHFYFRQFENKNTWFPSLGIDFSNFLLGNNFFTSIALHAWQQPHNLSFTQTEGKIGGGMDLTCKYRFPVNIRNKYTGISVNLGIIAKTQGFMLEEVCMDKHIGFRLGMSIWLN